MKVVPQAFYENTSVRKIMADGLSSVIHKRVSAPDLSNERYASTHAITVVIRGQLKIEPYERKCFFVHPKQMVFLPKGLYLISDIIPEKGAFEALVFFFSEEVISGFLRGFSPRIAPKVGSSPLVMPFSERLQKFADNLLDLYSETAPNKKITTAKLQEMLYLLSQEKEGQPFMDRLTNLKNRTRRGIRDFMAVNYDKPLGVEDYAYLTGRSISTFRRDFKRQFQISPKQWLIDHRLEKAYQLLTNGESNVTQTAFQVGYENLSHFIKAFQKKYQISPKQLVLKTRKKLEIK